ncbi:MAG: hypothetical protein RJA22_854 [Verrucomicrobiota bacterium]
MGMGLCAVVLLAVVATSIYGGKSLLGMWNYVDLDQRSQLAVDTLTKEVRETTSLLEFTTNRLTFSDSDGRTLVYEYSPVRRTLERVKGTNRTVMLTECDELSFSIFQRNPSNAVYDYFPTATATNCKLINVSWVCTRRILGSAINSESVQTAKVVIRKK